MRRIRILAVSLLAGLVLLMGMGAGACGGAQEEEIAVEEEEEVVAEEKEETAQLATGSDGRLRIVVDNLERVSGDIPRFEGSYGVRPLKPDEGVDRVVFHLTVVPMQDICVAMPEKCVLVDTDNNECTLFEVNVSPFMPSEVGSSCESYFGETEVKFSFPFPEYAVLEKLRFVYSFLEPGEGQTIQRGQIDVILP